MSEPSSNTSPAPYSDAEWQRTAQYAEEHASEFERSAPTPPCGCFHGEPTCNAMYKHFTCSRPRGHAGEHVACGENFHRLRVWKEIPSSNDLAQHIFDTLLASNRLMAEQLRRAP